jgi:di/tricarboxylate transporter
MDRRPDTPTRGCVLGLLAVASALSALVPSAAASTRLVITVRSVELSSKVTDALPKGRSVGDTLSFRNRLVNVAPQLGGPAGARIGSDRGTNRITGPGTFAFSATVTLPGGTLSVRNVGNATGSVSAPLSVTGGTGRFAGARGTVTLSGGASTTTTNTYRLRLP